MKITFFYARTEHIGIEYLSSILKKDGHETSLVFSPIRTKSDDSLFKKIFFKTDHELANEILSENPDIVAFSAITDLYGRMLGVAKKIKRLNPQLKIIFGGMHTTSVPEIVIAEPCVDYICIGEGLDAFPELINALKKNIYSYNIPNIWAKKNNEIIKTPLRPLKKDITDLPLPDKNLFMDKYPIRTKTAYLIFSAFGCPYNCSFCGNSVTKKLYDKNLIRRRDIQNIINELLIAKNQYKSQMIVFLDDIFTLDIKWLKEFCREYKTKIGLPFVCHIHTRCITPEMTAVLEEANCCYALLGIQSTSEHIRNDILKRNESNAEIVTAINLFKESKIKLFSTIMYDLPTETDEDLINMMYFLNKYPPATILPYKLRYYPGIEIIDIARKLNVLTDEDVKKINNTQEYNPFDFAKSSRKDNMLTLLFLSNAISEKTLTFLIKHKIYKYRLPFPVIGAIYYIYWRLIDLVKSMFRKKEKQNYLILVWKKTSIVTSFLSLILPNAISFFLGKRKTK